MRVLFRRGESWSGVSPTEGSHDKLNQRQIADVLLSAINFATTMYDYEVQREFHNQGHASFVGQQAEFWAKEMSLSDIDLVVAKIAGYYHDYITYNNSVVHYLHQSGINEFTSQLGGQAEGVVPEVISAIAVSKMLDKVAQEQGFINSDNYLKIKQKILVAILSTALNRELALPRGVGKGQSLIKQFFLSEVIDELNQKMPQLVGQLTEALGLGKSRKVLFLKGLINRAKREKGPALAVCMADLSHMCIEDEKIFWIFSVRFILETFATRIEKGEFTEGNLRSFYKGQKVYFENYVNNLPRGVDRDTKLKFKQGIQTNIQRIDNLLQKSETELWTWWERVGKSHKYISPQERFLEN